MSKPIVVCVFGNSGCGKNTFADQFIKEGFKYIHPIGDLKNFLEKSHKLPNGSLDTILGKLIKPEFQAKNEDVIEVDRIMNLVWDSEIFLYNHYGDELSVERDSETSFYVIPRLNLCLSKLSKIFWHKVLLNNDEIHNAYQLKGGEEHKTFGDLMINAYHEMKDIDPFFSRPYVKRELSKNIDNGDNTIMLAIRNQHEVDVILDLKREKEFDVIVYEIVRNNNQGLTTDVDQEKIMNNLTEKLNIKCNKFLNDQSLEDFIIKSKAHVDLMLNPVVKNN